MNRQNLFSDASDGENEDAATRHRVFWRPDDARMVATRDPDPELLARGGDPGIIARFEIPIE
jgi:hypothetical protein